MSKIFKLNKALTSRQYSGFTLIEVLTAIGILVIIIVVALINIRPSSKLEQLKTATDHLADDLKYSQTLATSNIKIKDVENKVERGYGYFFLEDQHFYLWYEILADSVSQTVDFDYDFLENKEYYYPEITLINIEASATPLGFSDTNIFKKIIPSALARAATVIDVRLLELINVAVVADDPLLQPAFFFPEAEIQFVEEECGGQPCLNISLYLKHDEVDSWQGKVTVDKQTGKITSEVIPYP